MLFNPDARSANFLLPGLVAIILQGITVLLTAFSIARARERETLEQLMVTPIRPFGLMLGKLVPYGVIAELCIVLAAMRLIFGVPIQGSLALLLAVSTLFLFCGLAIGLFVSAHSQKPQARLIAVLEDLKMPLSLRAWQCLASWRETCQRPTCCQVRWFDSVRARSRGKRRAWPGGGQHRRAFRSARGFAPEPESFCGSCACPPGVGG
jgi:hypothetical protein